MDNFPKLLYMSIVIVHVASFTGIERKNSAFSIQHILPDFYSTQIQACSKIQGVSQIMNQQYRPRLEERHVVLHCLMYQSFHKHETLKWRLKIHKFFMNVKLLRIDYGNVTLIIKHAMHKL
jgi:hypothetical protein